MILFSEAKQHGPYAYYHLLSGVDLPLVSQDSIHSFFEAHPNKIFLDLRRFEDHVIERIKYYHPFVRYYVRNQKNLAGFAVYRYAIHLLRRLLRKIQIMLKVNRLNANVKLGYASNWCSLNQETVEFLLSKENFIKSLTRQSFCSDELFIPTLLNTFGMEDKIYDKTENSQGLRGNLRYIDWDLPGLAPGSPHTFEATEADFQRLVEARALGHFWARKFDLESWPEMKDFIIDLINNV